MLSHLQFARLYSMPGADRVLVAPPAAVAEETRFLVTWRRRDGRFLRSQVAITLEEAQEYCAPGESIVAAQAVSA